MMEIINLSVKTRHLVYEDVSYTFRKGKLYGIVAVNGSGKTTLFRAVTGMIPVRTGEVLIDKKPLHEKKRHVFYYESFEWLDGNLSGLDYLQFVKGMWKSNVSIKEIIDDWKMEEYIHLPIKKYSLGMKQRVILSMYLISDAEYLIFDEITNGLDELNRDKLFSVLSVKAKEGKMILISSQYREDIEKYCDVILTIKDNKLIEI